MKEANLPSGSLICGGPCGGKSIRKCMESVGGIPLGWRLWSTYGREEENLGGNKMWSDPVQWRRLSG
jgi:hypothetical protein